jgi:dienelactone hydrolase
MNGSIPLGSWIGADDRPIAAWWSEPAWPSRSGVVIASPIGYEWWSTHRTVRTLAERLAARGQTVIRFDYDGTGDSAGGRWDDARVAAWRASLGEAVTALRSRGVEHVTIAGLRFGGLLALLDGAAHGADAVVGWVPVTSGRRFVKELRLLGIPVPERDGSSVMAGLVLTPDTVEAMGALDVATIAAVPAPRVLIATSPDVPLDDLAERLRAIGGSVEVAAVTGMEMALGVPSEDAVVPDGAIETIAAWIGDAPRSEAVAGSPALPSLRRDARIPVGDGLVHETIGRVGGLTAVRGGPADVVPDDAPRTVVAFLNSGSEAHVGPGRAWVDYARDLARAGIATTRVDFSGWGESPDRGHAPGRPYDRHCLDETIDLVAQLRTEFDRVVLAGLCAGAWMAMRAAQDVRVDGIVAINPQLYWDFGCPVEATIPQTRKRRTKEREREEFGRRYGIWSMLDVLGMRPMAARWFAALRRRRTRVLLLFAEGDDGLEYLHNRVARRFERELRQGLLQVAELPDTDHQMYREWRRPEIAERMAAFVAEVERGD